MKSLSDYGTFEVTLPERKRWNHKDGEVTFPAETRKVQLLMDSSAIIQQLGKQAIASKGKKSIALSGLIVVKVVS